MRSPLAPATLAKPAAIVAPPAIVAPAPASPPAIPAAVPRIAPAPAVPLQPAPEPALKSAPPASTQPLPASPPQAAPDPLPTQPALPPQRPEPLPAPPNRVNVTPPQQAGGGLVAAVPRSAGPTGLAANALGAARVEEARRLLAQGRVLAARAQLENAIAMAPGPALHELARTYDPYYLGQLPSIDDGSEPRRAMALYQDAILNGAISAGVDLDRLRSTLPPGR